MLVSRKNTGFQLCFSNGYEITCLFSIDNLCARNQRHDFDDYMDDGKEFEVRSDDCEVSIKKGNTFVTEEIAKALNLGWRFGRLMTIGFVNADDVGKIISYLVNLKD